MSPYHGPTVANALREMARAYEAGGTGGFTCLHIGSECGPLIRRAYEDAFGFADNEIELFNRSYEDIHEMRVLMLCFAAAMAETGDL